VNPDIAAALDLVDAGFDLTVDTRRVVHAMPELAFQERETTRLIRDRLSTLPGRTSLPH